MQIKRIVSLKEYKSFIDFKWSDFCKGKIRQTQTDGTEIEVLEEKKLNNFNLFFGENGSGKSSICETLKDISHHAYYHQQNTLSTSAEIEVKKGGTKVIHKFQNGSWDSTLDAHSILFFDKDFIDKNIHTNGDRSNEKNRHSQNSGQLIIQLDETANDYKSKIIIKEQEVKDFQSKNSQALNQQFDEQQENFFKTYENITDSEKDELIKNQKEILDNSVSEQKRLDLLKIQSSKISAIISPAEIKLNKTLSDIKTYQEIFTRKIEEETQKEISEQIKNHITKHRLFIEKGLEILSESEKKDNCPFCLQSLSNSQELIKSYSEFFNESYKRQKQKLINDITTLKEELEGIENEIKGLPNQLSSAFNQLEKLSTDFSIPNLYDQKRKEEMTKSFEGIKTIPKEFQSLKKQLDDLKSIDNSVSDYSESHKSIEEFIASATEKLTTVNQIIKNASDLISDFKKKYSDLSTIQQEIDAIKLKIQNTNAIIDFFEKNIFSRMKAHKPAMTEYLLLSGEFEKLKTENTNYLAKRAPEIVLKRMTEILERFNLTFTLQPEKITRQTSEFPFSFKVIDKDGKERNIKTGLSEGERQLISIAFFFAIIEKTPKKNEKILVFDDPVTSLDSANLKILSDLIFEQVQQKIFSQILVFTHHPLFHKYLAKNGPQKFGVLKNHKTFGGSFIYVDPGFDTTDELRNCNQTLLSKAQQQQLNVEEVALQYGHLLRLTIERFIKNELLLWNTEKEFGKIVEELEDGKAKIRKLESADINVIKEVYKYCNHSNLHHADKEASSALTELLLHIDKFVGIIDKVNAPHTVPVSP